MKRVAGLAAVASLLIFAGFGLFFLIELYRPFTPRVVVPDKIEMEYTGPGAISSQSTDGQDPSSSATLDSKDDVSESIGRTNEE